MKYERKEQEVFVHIDEYIKIIDQNICENIDKLKDLDRGFLSQNIIAQLRNLVEHVFVKIKTPNADIQIDFMPLKGGEKYVKGIGRYKWLSNFHKCLEASSSHYTRSGDISERLMLKYYEYLIRLRDFLQSNYSFAILENLNKFPLNQDKSLLEFYELIVPHIESIKERNYNLSKYRYRIFKKKPFFINEKIYYEITLTSVNSKKGKYDRVVAFTKYDILDNYDLKISLKNRVVNYLNHAMPIQIIDGWQVSIRPCTLSNLARIFDPNYGRLPLNQENHAWMDFLTDRRLDLLDVLDLDDDEYEEIKAHIFDATGMKERAISNLFDRCRPFIKVQHPGSNVLRYLLYIMDNDVIRNQLNWKQQNCHKLSNLYLSYKCIPFDEMPFCTSLIKHNPALHDLIACINSENRECEFFDRTIKNNIETEGVLFTKEDELDGFEKKQELLARFNFKLFDDENGNHVQCRRRIWLDNGFYTIRSYVEDIEYILNRLKSYTSGGVEGYDRSYEAWIFDKSEQDVCTEKRNILKKLFNSGNIALIYGPAGTGKTKMIEFISQIFSDLPKLYLAHTNPAVENLKRKVPAVNATFSTITKYLSAGDFSHYAVLFVDECSTVNNSDMKTILQRENFSLIVLVGDIYQIESIQFGNWFALAQKFIPKKYWYELETPYRTQNNELLKVWSKVRNLEFDALEYLTHYGYIAKLDDSIFSRSTENEIILCLNYGGLYGINNINHFMQSGNTGKAFRIGIHLFKEGDPILFNDSDRFAPILYNNLKGRIEKIEPDGNKVWFTISVEKMVNKLEAEIANLEWVNIDDLRTYLKFPIESADNDDEEYVDVKTIVPFQVAYAVSIHKAQGLEYDSVKVVISSEVDEQVTHNIFYTAITRARKKLKIYWTPETEYKVFEKMKKKNYDRDAGLLKRRLNVN